jgi:hypothetical protein
MNQTDGLIGSLGADTPVADRAEQKAVDAARGTLRAELAAEERAAQRRRSRLALVLVPAVLAVLAVTGFTTYALTREPSHLESVGCFETAELDGNIAVVNADGRAATAVCAELWRQGDLGPGPAPKSLAACVLETGAVGVFPSSGKDTCEQLGLADLPLSYAAEAERFAALRDAIAADLGASYGSTERDPKCLREEEARALIRHELDARGYEDWSIEVIGGGFTERPCAAVGLGFDGERKVVFLVPEPDE